MPTDRPQILTDEGRPRGADVGAVLRIETMVLDRLIARLDEVWSHRVAVVVAPPGSGKSSLLATFAAHADVPVAWYGAHRWDGSLSAFLRRLSAAFSHLSTTPTGPWLDVSEMRRFLEGWDPSRALMVIDDLHAVEGTPSERALEQLIELSPPGLRLVMASRSQPRLNMSRLAVSGELLRIDADELRFRSWEVEQLFRDHYRESMAPEELARLAHWTHGWAAGLQLFHLATRGRPADERRRVLRSLGPRSRLAHEYLAQNALDRVRSELRSFLVETSVLGRLDRSLCDRLLGRPRSERLLQELERRCLFTSRIGADDGYRYHEVFRSHLQGVLIAEIGEEAARARFRAAGELLLSEGYAADALEAYVRAEAWEVVEQLLESDGEAIADEPSTWLVALAGLPLRDDAWLALAGARRLRAEGHFQDAIEAYAVVIRDHRAAAAAAAARQEQTTLLWWLEPGRIGRPAKADSAMGMLRDALLREPGAVVARAAAEDDAAARVVASIAMLLAGKPARAHRELSDVMDREDAGGLVGCVAAMVRGTAALLAGDSDGVADLNGAIGAAEGLGWDWLARLGRSLLALSGRLDHARESIRLEAVAAAHGDHWGMAITRLARAWGLVMTSGHRYPPAAEREDLAELVASVEPEFELLGAPVLAAWAAVIGLYGAALVGAPLPSDAVGAARAMARSTAVSALTEVLSMIDAPRSPDASGHQSAMKRTRGGIALPSLDRPQPDHAIASSPAVRTESSAPPAPAVLRLLGGFAFEIGGEALQLSSIRPGVRQMLYLLALHVDAPVHQERIAEILWPEVDPVAASRSLHVAVASLRRVLEPGAKRGGFKRVLRDGEAYRLTLPPGSNVDVLGFDHAVVEARRAAGRGDAAAVERWATAALDRYTGELLPEVGPADWVVQRRDLLHVSAVETATLLASSQLASGELAASARASTRGLELDRYHDPLWRTLIEARQRSGDHAAASTARSNYRAALDELGLGDPADVDERRY